MRPAVPLPRLVPLAMALLALVATALTLVAPVATAHGPSSADAAVADRCPDERSALAQAGRRVERARAAVRRSTTQVARARRALRAADTAGERTRARKALVRALRGKVGAVRGLDRARQARQGARRELASCRTAQAALPLVTGPVTGGEHGFPGTSTSVDLAAAGYSEEEFLLSGDATAYRAVGAWGTDGAWEVRPHSVAPYTTRVLVRAPEDPERFNGTVVVEWLNVSGGVDVDVDFAYMHEELLRGGYAWVGVSAQQVGIHGSGPSQLGPDVVGLKAWDPERYAALDHPGDEYSYDIFTDAGSALLAARGDELLPGLEVEQLLAVGQSQSGMRMLTYANAVQPVADVYDGLFVHARAGRVAPLNATTPTPSPARVRTDLDVPVLQFLTETELFTLGGPDPENLFFSARQPDTDLIRTWEVAGTAHSDEPLLRVIHPQYVKQFGDRVNPLDRLFGIINNGPQDVVAAAALRALRTWVVDGVAPTSADPIETADGDIVRDADGNALGGVRTPQLDVPIASHTGENVAIPNNGATTLFTAERLAELYPTHAAYVAAFREATQRAVAAGFVLPEDAEALIAEAEASGIGG